MLKIHSPQITHKTDVQGVMLNLAGDEEVRRAFDRITTTAMRLRPDAKILGVTIEPMVTALDGLELIVGTKRDPVFGPVILVGAGGIAAELFQDRAIGLPPLNDRLARQMLASLRPGLCCKDSVGGKSSMLNASSRFWSVFLTWWRTIRRFRNLISTRC